jgi:hypothetical protein
MNTKSDKAIDWLKLSVEGAVIVASILLAFALQAWWDDRRDTITEQEMLVALQSELQGALDMLDNQLSLMELQATSSMGLADTMREAGEGEMATVNSHDVATMFNYATYDPPFGIAGALLDSGQASILSNAELRAALGRWPAAIADAVEDQILLERMGMERIGPLVQRSIINMKPVYTSNIEEQLNRDSSFAILDSESEIVASRELWNVLYQRHTRTLVAMGDLGRARQQLLQLIDLVDGELE